MIVLDTARPDLLSAYGHGQPTSPFLERFAAGSRRFDRAYSSSSWTLPAHASLFTGTSPRHHGATQSTTKVSDALPLLPEQLRDAGYQTAGFSGNVWVTDLGGLTRGFEHFEDLNTGIYRKHVRRLARDFRGRAPPPEDHYIVSRVRSWLRNDLDTSRPFFVFVNLVEAHLPYLPSWQAARPFVPSLQARWNTIQHFYPGSETRGFLTRHYAHRHPLSRDEWEAVTRMYEGSLRMDDGLARALVAAVDSAVASSDPSRETLIFILSDHGENLGDHGHIGHIFNLYDSNIRIALVARGPGFQPGSAEENLVQITDVYATVLAAAGLERPAWAEGVDLRAPVPTDRVLSASLAYPRISLGLFPDRLRKRELGRYAVELAAAVGPRFKLIRATSRQGDVVSEEFYDLLADPSESHRLDSTELDADCVERLLEAVESGTSAAGSSSASPDEALGEIDEGFLEGLRALGYAREGDPEGTETNVSDDGGTHSMESDGSGH
jgi:arylsulfatase A-like enzyme